MSLPNPLNIQEPQLLRYHNEIEHLFSLNNLEFDCEYDYEPNPALNSSVNYYVEINGILRSGFITHVKGKTKKSRGKFGGAVIKPEMISYLEREGFSEEHIETKGEIFASAPSPQYFFAMLCIPILKDLIIENE